MLNLAVYSVIVVRSTIKLSAVVDTNLRLILGLRVNGATECRSHDAGTPQLRTNFTEPSRLNDFLSGPYLPVSVFHPCTFGYAFPFPHF